MPGQVVNMEGTICLEEWIISPYTRKYRDFPMASLGVTLSAHRGL
jgi:hypothetical protein